MLHVFKLQALIHIPTLYALLHLWRYLGEQRKLAGLVGPKNGALGVEGRGGSASDRMPCQEKLLDRV